MEEAIRSNVNEFKAEKKSSCYTEEEVTSDTRYSKLLTLSNITFKFGRFKLNDESRFDDVLGIELASQNQYGKEYNTLA